MPALHENLRRQLERTIIAARETAEAAAKAALGRLAVDQPEPFRHQTPHQRKLRNQLRARARQLGDVLEQKTQAIGHLIHELAYEQWHRMLFARFLAENGLLIHPDFGVPVTLQECEDLAKEEAAPATKSDHWALAGRFASKMLPQIFRPDDPLLQVTLAPEDQQALEKLLESLPGGHAGVFTADDSLGWVYQFWQTNEKKRVNESEDKITGDTICAVTQLFTEHYMVLFLLHNSLGAWHAAKVLAANPKLALSAKSEDELRSAVSLDGYSFDYLRFVRAEDSDGPWQPAAGSFGGWPKTAARLKMLDPCCGSGHFLVAGLEVLARLRMAEEGLDIAHAVDAVLTDNLFGLELDGRCTQIAAFNLALAAWKLAGHRKLPRMQIACTGIGPQATREQWLKLAQEAREPMSTAGREAIENGLLNLHELFSKARTLGSLIGPNQLPGDLIAADYKSLLPYLTAALSAESTDDEGHERAVAAAGMVKAAELLAGNYTLVVTNVPYLGRIRQDEVLRAYCDDKYPHARLDLATCFVERCLSFCGPRCTVAVVLMQNSLFLATYKKFRQDLLRNATWNIAAKLGPKGFQTPMWDFGVALLGLTHQQLQEDASISGIELVNVNSPAEKAIALRATSIRVVAQKDQLRNPDAAIIFEPPSELKRLSTYAESYQGASTVEIERFRMYFWEVTLNSDWNLHQSTPKGDKPYSGLEYVSVHRRPGGAFHEAAAALKAEGRLGGAFSGQPVWGKSGVACSWMGTLPAAIYLGVVYDNSIAAIVPQDEANLLPIWCFCTSPQFLAEVRKINQKTQVANATLVKVPFDLAYWQKAAGETYPHGLPDPESDDPTQWLFHGRPEASGESMQVAVARLVGYRWPAEVDERIRLGTRARGLVAKAASLIKYADDDGIVCVPSVRGEEPAADRLLALLSACGIKPDRAIDGWLRDNFFQEHCDLFHCRPFVWHIWDGRREDGFHALIEYHKLADGKKGKKLLETLTYMYLGDWINRQKADVKAEKAGAEARLIAALELQKKLEAILVGEPPFDIFVRWKPLHEQPVGWEPDVNDGVRLNIRPFVEAGILRRTPNIRWTKDRGKDPEAAPWFKVFKGERVNDHHLTNAEKLAAREKVRAQ